MAKRKAKRYYILKKGNKVAVFTGRQPRQAALKAATRGYTDIKLRERGRRNKDRTYTIHKFRDLACTVGMTLATRVPYTSATADRLTFNYALKLLIYICLLN